jgi:FkbM family methyltransferase
VLRRLAAPRLLRAFARVYPEALFVEIGSNDGDQHDHLRPIVLSHPWSGIMVEPVPYVFERLRRNYVELPRIALANVAIAGHDGSVPFYHLAPPSESERDRLPSWYDAVGSLSREVVLSHGHDIPDIESRLVCTVVPCLTFQSLCRRYGLERVDLLAIDTEGYDSEVIRHIDFAAYRPRLLAYEHFHLSAEERARCRELLEGVGYETLEEGFDTWCLDPEADEGLTRMWRNLRPGVRGVSADEQRT